MTFSRVSAGLLVLTSLLGPPAAAQLTPEEAAKLLKVGASAALKSLKAELKLDASMFVVAIAALEDKADAGTFTLADFDAFCTDIDTFQRVVASRANAASQHVAEAVAAAWSGLPTEAYTQLPEGFYIGDGGTLDKFRTDSRKVLDKAYASLRKKLGKLADRLAAKANARLVFRIEPPVGLDDWVCISQNFPFETTLVPLTVDTVFVITDTTLNETHGCMAGAGKDSEGMVTMGLTYGVGFCTGLSMAPVVDGRWSGLPELPFGSGCAANYFCSVKQGDAKAWTLTIGWPGLLP